MKCPTCNGTGKQTIFRRDKRKETIICLTCNGTGKIPGRY